MRCVCVCVCVCVWLTRGVDGMAGVSGSSLGAEFGCSRPSSLAVRRCLRFNSECSSMKGEGEREREREKEKGRGSKEGEGEGRG